MVVFMARDKVVECLRAQLGDQYQWATAGPDTFDCSGLAAYCYKQVGYDLSRASAAQAHEGRSIPLNQAQPGDLLIYDDGNHVGIVISKTEAIHALNDQLDIRIVPIDSKNLGVTLTDVRSILPYDESGNFPPDFWEKPTSKPEEPKRPKESKRRRKRKHK